MLELNQPLQNLTLVAFDTETSGAYPVGNDIVEFGAVKYYQGREVDRIQMFIKPREAMSDFIIGIHGITNEMVAEAPPMGQVIHKILDFLKDSVVVAHHAPFDVGFLVYEIEKAHLNLPQSPILCSSLLARKLIQGTENHKLQTLVKHFGFDGGAAHRALDDARSCLMVILECLKVLPQEVTLQEVQKIQEKQIGWSQYLILKSGQNQLVQFAEAIEGKKIVEISYEKGGAGRAELRQIRPQGIVRNPDGDYIQAFCLRDGASKRFYLPKIKDLEIKYG